MMDKLTILKVKKTLAWIEINKVLKEKILALKDVMLSGRITRSEYDREMAQISHTIDFLKENMENLASEEEMAAYAEYAKQHSGNK